MARQYHMAAGGWRVEHRDLADRRSREHEDHRGVHGGAVKTAGGTDAPDSGQAFGGGEQSGGGRSLPARSLTLCCYRQEHLGQILTRGSNKTQQTLRPF